MYSLILRNGISFWSAGSNTFILLYIQYFLLVCLSRHNFHDESCDSFFGIAKRRRCIFFLSPWVQIFLLHHCNSFFSSNTLITHGRMHARTITSVNIKSKLIPINSDIPDFSIIITSYYDLSAAGRIPGQTPNIAAKILTQNGGLFCFWKWHSTCWIGSNCCLLSNWFSKLSIVLMETQVFFWDVSGSLYIRMDSKVNVSHGITLFMLIIIMLCYWLCM